MHLGTTASRRCEFDIEGCPRSKPARASFPRWLVATTVGLVQGGREMPRRSELGPRYWAWPAINFCELLGSSPSPATASGRLLPDAVAAVSRPSTWGGRLQDRFVRAPSVSD